MEIAKKFQDIAKETAGSYFKLSLQANSDQWTLYIYRSKISFTGSLEEVMIKVIDEFLKYRTPTPNNVLRKIKRPFQYLKFTEEKKMAEMESSKPEGSYKQKLEFSLSKGYKNVADCYYNLGPVDFNKEYNEYLKITK